MKVVIDIEANGLVNPTQIWLIVCKDIDTGEYHIFKNITSNSSEKERYIEFSKKVTYWIGHNLLDYDAHVLNAHTGQLVSYDFCNVCDTLVVSKLLDYSRKGGHSVEDYGTEFGFEKGSFNDFTNAELYNADSLLSRQLCTYCILDVDITHKIYLKYIRFLKDSLWEESLKLEHQFINIVNTLGKNGFSFNKNKATKLLHKVTNELLMLDKDILSSFPPREVLIKEFTPKATKFGSISKTSVPRALWDKIAEYEVGKTYRHTHLVEFNPSSHKQIIQVLHEAGWRPVNKTKTHIEAERELNRLKYGRRDKTELDLAAEETILLKLKSLRISGFKTSEENLATLPNLEHLEQWISKCRIKIPNEEQVTVRNIIQRMLLSSAQPQGRFTIKILELLKTNNSEEITELLLLILSACLPNKTDAVKFVESEKSLWSIIVTPQEMFVDCSASFVTDTWAGLRDTVSMQTRISQNKAARTLAQRILLEARRRTLEEWISLVDKDNRIRGRFHGIGAWTHRMAHQHPNTANIPTDAKLYGNEMRSLWQAPKNRLLVGVDAEGIQLRIFAHYINDPEFTDALVRGSKTDKTDPHSLNQRIIGNVCKNRQVAKRFIYALLLGAGLQKLAAILKCEVSEAKEALDRLLTRYDGWAALKEEAIPSDAKRGYFRGLDGRLVRIPRETISERKHLVMSGYLQNGEAVVMKKACCRWADKLKEDDALLVNFVHDEWQTECPNNMEIALKIAKLQADSLREVGEELNLKCPLAGSYWNDDLKDYTIGTNWKVTH